MKNVIEALLIVWPRGIPANEYERALSLAAKMGALAPSLRPVNTAPVDVVTSVSRRRRVDPTRVVSAVTADMVRQMLQTGPCTTQEIMDATGLTRFSVWSALKVVGSVKEKRMFGRKSGAPTFVYVLKEAA